MILVRKVHFIEKFLNFHLFIFACAGSSLLRTGFPQLWQLGGCSLVAVHGLLIAVASRVVDHRLWGVQASVVVAQQLQFPGFRKPRLKVVALRLSCSMACEIFWDQGWNSGPLRWQADS